MPLSSTSTWRSYFSQSKYLDNSNKIPDKIRDSVSTSILFNDSFELTSKNEGIAFILLDPSETEIQLFHHSTTLGGSLTDPDKQLIIILHLDEYPKPIQILPKFIKDLKLKSHSANEFNTATIDNDGFNSLKKPKIDFIYKNLIPIPNILTNAYLSSKNTDRISIASVFFETMSAYDKTLEIDLLDRTSQDFIDKENISVIDSPPDSSIGLASSANKNTTRTSSNSPKFLENFIHVVQFCHLCSKGKMPAIHYKLTTSPEIMKWFLYMMASCGLNYNNKSKKQFGLDNEDSVFKAISSLDCKVSRTDHHLLKTILKK
jgi:hypothetical protein